MSRWRCYSGNDVISLIVCTDEIGGQRINVLAAEKPRHLHINLWRFGMFSLLCALANEAVANGKYLAALVYYLPDGRTLCRTIVNESQMQRLMEEFHSADVSSGITACLVDIQGRCIVRDAERPNGYTYFGTKQPAFKTAQP